MALNVIEQCRVAPPSGTAAEHSLPLTFWDARWLNFHPVPVILFYKFSQSKYNFIETTIPKLKESLSITLKYYLPLASNLIFPDSGKPELKFVEGNSVPIIFAVSNDDFNYLVGDPPKNCNRFYPLVPQVPPAFTESGSTKTPVFALQVTLFPEIGISIAYSMLHLLGDASSLVGFLKAWGSIFKFGGNENFIPTSSLPFYDRSMIKDPYNLLEKILIEKKKQKNRTWDLSEIREIAADKVRATFVMHQTDIKHLKNYVLSKRPKVVHLSSWTVTCAYLWVCWLKSMEAIGEQVDDSETEYFLSAVNYRARLDPPMPSTYFGSAIVPSITKARHGEIIGPDGFATAAALIGEAIHRRVSDRESVLKGDWLNEVEEVKKGRFLGTNGSPLFDTYGTDFGWGKAEKYESISIDIDGGMAIERSRKFEGGLEIGLSLPGKRMDAFGAFFNSFIKTLLLQPKI
ncbi:hypothetical protein M9H77_20340 [Catharanthus roseus]|uniref:Uncharacterized protein n=1 Tax=Catharanthus roseus TaxID=4058 RepID=A0ACC0AJB7_CATRO|nr:hypothetical protein M9H77_20340 [Catharanthus roseus]